MFGHKKKRRGRDQDFNYPLTPGQTFDVAETTSDAFRGFSGSAGPLNPATVAFAGLDVAFSAGSSKPGEMGGRMIGAVAAQTAGVASWYVGGGVGRTVGAEVGGFVGGIFGGPIGAGAGVVAGSVAGSIIGRFGLPILVDPYVRRISRPINKFVGWAQRRVNFGGFQDSAPAYTMRQRALQEMNQGLLNATQYMGREAQLMHQ